MDEARVKALEHILKTHPAQFDAVARGDKSFEVRRDDRGFQKGDVLILQRCRDDKVFSVDWDSFHKPALGERPRACRELRKRIKWVLTGGQYGIEAGYVVLALEDEPLQLAEPPPLPHSGSLSDADQTPPFLNQFMTQDDDRTRIVRRPEAE